MFDKFMGKRKEKRIVRNEKLREKNAKLRREGKEPLKGWGKMINTGLGGLNNQGNEIDNRAFWREEQKNARKEK